jgi:uncharacterized low-complexity protein
VDDLTSFESALACVDTRGSAAIPVKQTNKRRSKNLVMRSPSTPPPQCVSCDSQVSEVDRFQAVLLHPAFKANPFATVFEHLENSITSMHAKATAKAEEKEIRSQSKVHCLFSCHCVSAPHLHREPLLNNGIAGSERAHRRETRAGEGECKVHQAAAQTDRKCSANVGRIFCFQTQGQVGI